MSKFANFTLNMHTEPEKAKLEGRLTPDRSIAIQITNVHIVEKMTERKRVGIIIEMVDENGKRYHANTTAQLIMNGVAAAARGFCMRVGDNPDMA